ncbi:MAG: sulfite oxidase [Thermoplasmata archaeon]|nr:sulfite oxidase [Thermoplasmata archaeon]
MSGERARANPIVVESPAKGTVGPPSSDELEVVVREPLCAEVPLTALNSWITPTPRFFVRSHFPAPHVDLPSYRLAVDGEVDRAFTLSYPELRKLPDRTVVATMECAGNSRTRVYPPAEGVPWKHGALGTARWRGVPLADLLARAGLRRGATEVVLEGADRGRERGVAGEIGYAMSVPVDKAMDPDTLLALEMNGADLEPRHGFPVRAVVPGWYGMASVKWLTRISVIDHPFQGYYRTRPYVFIHEGDDPESSKKPVTTLQVKSLITWPSEDAVLSTGSHVVRGVAWGGSGTITRVEVTTLPVDGWEPSVPWAQATLLEPRARHAWVRWECPLRFDAPGYHVIRVRAVDDAGTTQPLYAPWNFRGVATNSIHAIPVIVRAPEGSPADRPAEPRDG